MEGLLLEWKSTANPEAHGSLWDLQSIFDSLKILLMEWLHLPDARKIHI